MYCQSRILKKVQIDVFSKCLFSTFFSAYVLFVLSVWVIVSNDQRRKNAFVEVSESSRVETNKTLPNEPSQIEFIDLRGQEAEDDNFVDREIRTTIKTRKKISPNYSKVENLDFSEVLNSLSSMGISPSGVEIEDRKPGTFPRWDRIEQSQRVIL